MKKKFTNQFLILCFIVASTACEMDWYSKGRIQTEVFSIPGTQLLVEIQKTSAHAFLAEYDFKLILMSEGLILDSIEMTGDSGGLSRIDVMRTTDGNVVFMDHGQWDCVNTVERRFHTFCESNRTCGDLPQGVRLGGFDFDRTRSWRFLKNEELPTEPAYKGSVRRLGCEHEKEVDESDRYERTN